MVCFQEHPYGCLRWDLFQLPFRKLHLREKHAGWVEAASEFLLKVQSFQFTHTHTPVSQPLDNFSVIFIYSPNPTFLVNFSKDTVSKAGQNSAILPIPRGLVGEPSS